jgi:hypothetical protein
MTDKSRLCSRVRWWLLACVLVAVPAAFAQDAHEAIERAPYSDKTEPPRDSAKDLAKNIVLDQNQIWTSSIPDVAPEREMVADLRRCYRRSDRRQTAAVRQQLLNTGDQLAFSRRASRLGAVYTLVAIAGGFYFERSPDQAVEIARHGIAWIRGSWTV